MLPIVLYGCDTLFLTLKEGHKLRVFENRVLKRILRPKRDEVIGGRRKLHNKELHDLNSSPSIIRMIKSRTVRLAGRVGRIGGRRGMHVCRSLVGIPEGKRSLRRLDVDGRIILRWILDRMGWYGLY
jgi:hypothetical protein